MKNFIIYMILNKPIYNVAVKRICNKFNFDYKEYFVKLVRGKSYI